jgi:Holliday junction DNA helicase RuvA
VISSLRGVLQAVGEGQVSLEVGGVGLQIFVPASVSAGAPPIGQFLSLHTRLLVREDALFLYGFRTPEERAVFDMLLQVNGVGPRLALSVLSHLEPAALFAAVAGDQLARLTGIPGVGRKTAERIVFHLKDRLPKMEAAPPAPKGVDVEVMAALNALGYSQAEAQAAIQSIADDSEESIEGRVRQALRYFARP